MKESACLVNILKERMIDGKEFTKVLKEVKIMGVALDFLSLEPPEDTNYREWTMLFLPLTLGVNTRIGRISKSVIENISIIQKEKKPLDIVN